MDSQSIIINNSNVQKNSGCFGGCGTLIAVMLVIGLAVEYWYISLGVAVIGIAAAVWHYRQQPELPASPPAARFQIPDVSHPAASSVADAPLAVCARCGTSGVTTAFCGICGHAQSNTCAGCGITGLHGQFCPDCGSATYTPPSTT